MTQQEFEESIAHFGLSDRECNQIWDIYQAFPFYQAEEAFLPVRIECEEQAKIFWKNINPEMSEFFNLVQGKEKSNKDEDYLFLNSDQYYFHLYLGFADKTFIGYHNIYRILKEVALFCEDTKFFLKDLNSNWADEYTISNGDFSFCRHTFSTASSTTILSLFEQLALENPSLKLFSALAYFDQVKFSIDEMKRNQNYYLTKLEDEDLSEMKQFFDKALKLYEGYK
jgi:hypothetical protein